MPTTVTARTVPPKQLTQSIDSSALTMVLDNIHDWDGVTNLAQSNFGSRLFASFTNPTKTRIEIVEVNPATIANASITLIARGCGFDGSYTPVTANKLSWTAGDTIVQLGADIPQLFQSFQDYIDGLLIGAASSASDSTFGYSKITENLSSKPRTMAVLVSEQGTPDLTLKVNPFAIAASDQAVTFAGGNTGTFSAPVSNPRIDLVVYSTTGAALAIRGGTEGVSPSEPTPTTGDVVLASVFLRVGTTVIHERDTSVSTHAYIKRWYQPQIYTASAFGDVSTSFGDGSDGSATFSDQGGVQTGTTKTDNTSGATIFRLDRDVYYTSCTVNSTVTLNVNGYKIYCTVEMSGAGTVSTVTPSAGGVGANANTGTGGVAGAAYSSGGPLTNVAGGAGGVGGTYNSTGSGAGAGGGVISAFDTATAGSTGGAGNPVGSVGSNRAGGAGGAGSQITYASKYGTSYLTTYMVCDFSRVTPFFLIRSAASAGGGGGGGATTSTGQGAGGGGGGASGGVVFISASTWSGTFTIRSIGGAGGNGGNGSATGGGIQYAGAGGSGGNGGVSVVIYTTKTWSGTHTLTGGAAGSTGSTNTSNDGVSGATGTSIQILKNSLKLF